MNENKNEAATPVPRMGGNTTPEAIPESSERAPSEPVASIGDDPEFQEISWAWAECATEQTTASARAFDAMVAYIDTLLAARKAPAKLSDAQVGQIIAEWARTSNSRFELCSAIESAITTQQKGK